MSATLIAVVLALVAGHFLPQLGDLRRFDWTHAWFSRIPGAGAPWFTNRFALLLSLGIPVALVGLAHSMLALWWFGLPGFVFAVIMLFYCWGPHDLDHDVEAAAAADDPDTREAALQRLLPSEPGPTPRPAERVFVAALERWFAVLLWFLLLGPAGALLYRLSHFAEASESLPEAQRQAAARLRAVLEWPAAHLMCLALAVVGNFDTVLLAWRSWHARHDGFPQLESGFLREAASASVATELVEAREDEPPTAETASDPVADALRDALSLAWRCMLAWLALLAVFLVAGFVG
jgi:AmpE protein